MVLLVEKDIEGEEDNGGKEEKEEGGGEEEEEETVITGQHVSKGTSTIPSPDTDLDLKMNPTISKETGNLACDPTGDPSSTASPGESKDDQGSLEMGLDPPDKGESSLDPPDLISGPPSAKDTGYAWVVLFLVYMVNLVTAGNFKSFGITYTIIMDYFPDASGAASGWILGLLMGCRCLLSPVMGALTVTIGPRKCVMLGALICSGSFLLAVPAFSIEYMAFTLGAVFGAGMCMAETPGYIVVTDYFEKKRSLANGVRAAGNPMGGVIFSPLVVLLHQHFGFKGAFIMMAGIMLQLVIFGMLMRSYEQHKVLVEANYWRQERKKASTVNSQIRHLKDQQHIQEKKKKKKPLDFTFFKNPSYLVYLIVVLTTTAALPNALFYLPVYGRTIGLTDMQNSFISSYCSLSDSVMRLACGWIFSYNIIKKTHGFIAGLLVGAAGCLLVPVCGVMWHLVIAATMFSMCMGFFWTLINVLLADQFGGDSMPSTWGFFRMVQGICSFMYPPFIGFIMDVTGGMTAPYVVMGSLLILGAAIFSLQPLIAKLPGSKITLT